MKLVKDINKSSKKKNTIGAILIKKNKLSLTTSKANERARIGGKKKVNAFRDGFLILRSMINLFFNKN